MNTVAELLRLLHNLIRLGTIAEVDVAAARARVQSGDNLTDWLPWLSTRAGTTRDWDPPTVGEQVLLLSPGGDLGQAIVVTGIYTDQAPAPVTNGNVWKRTFPDGTSLAYDHAENHLTIAAVGNVTIEAAADLAVSAGGEIDIKAAGNVSIKGAQVHLN